MANFWCISPNWYGTGLSNQLFFIITAIIKAHKQKIPLVIFDKFRLQPCSDKLCPLKDIIDLNFLNEISTKYNVSVLDGYGAKLSLVSAKYGTTDVKINITEEIRNSYLQNNKLYIPKHVFLNNIKGDPIVGQQKKLFLTYKINEFVFTENFNEHLRDDILIELTHFHQFTSWHDVDINTHDPEMFKSILKQIKFTNLFNNISEHCLLVDKNNKYVLNDLHKNINGLNVIHLRLESDMTYNMSVHNKMNEKDYITVLENKYIELIKTHFSKDCPVLVLSYDGNNRVVDYLKENGYDFYMTKKNILEGREPHAIIDLLVGEKCSGSFIGNWNHTANIGSTFSYVLDQRMHPSVKRIFIDIYDINAPEVVTE